MLCEECKVINKEEDDCDEDVMSIREGAARPPPVAIVPPHRSNSLDFLNFEEKRQLIASSLSLSEYLHRGGSATSPSSPTSGPLYPTGRYFPLKTRLLLVPR